MGPGAEKNKYPVDGKFVQVLQVNNNHWICVAGNKNNEISVYDSMGGNLS